MRAETPRACEAVQTCFLCLPFVFFLCGVLVIPAPHPPSSHIWSLNLIPIFPLVWHIISMFFSYCLELTSRIFLLKMSWAHFMSFLIHAALRPLPLPCFLAQEAKPGELPHLSHLLTLPIILTTGDKGRPSAWAPWPQPPQELPQHH